MICQSFHEVRIPEFIPDQLLYIVPHLEDLAGAAYSDLFEAAGFDIPANDPVQLIAVLDDLAIV